MKTKLLLRAGLLVVWLIATAACQQHESAVNPAVSKAGQNRTVQPFADTVKQNEKTVVVTKAADQSTDVWICKSGASKKYHYNRDCGGLKRCKHNVEKTNVEDAEAIGLTQCSYKKCR